MGQVESFQTQFSQAVPITWDKIPLLRSLQLIIRIQECKQREVLNTDKIFNTKGQIKSFNLDENQLGSRHSLYKCTYQVSPP